MKDKSTLIRVCIYIVITSIMIFWGQKVTNVLLGILIWSLYLVAFLLLISWKTFNATWVCDHCNEKFKISLWASIKSFSIFSIKNKLYYRQLNCDKCNKKTWSRCIFEE